MKKSPCDLYCTAFPSNHLNAAAKRQSLCYRLKSFRHLSKWKTGEPSGSLHGNATPRIDHPAQGMAAAAATFRRAPDRFPTRKYTPCCGFGFCDTNFFFCQFWLVTYFQLESRRSTLSHGGHVPCRASFFSKARPDKCFT